MDNETRGALKRIILFAYGYRNADFPVVLDAEQVESWMQETAKEEAE